MKPTRLDLLEHVSTEFSRHLDEGETLETVLDPDYWSHVAAKARPGDKIRVEAYDRSWVAELYVRATSRLEVIVGVTNYTEFDGPAARPKSEEVPYEVAFRGPRKWSVIHKATKDVLKEDIQTRDEAERYVKNHMQAQAA